MRKSHEVDGLKIRGPGEADVAASNNVGPVSGEDVLTVRFPLDLPAHDESCTLEPEGHAPDARKQIAACHGTVVLEVVGASVEVVVSVGGGAVVDGGGVPSTIRKARVARSSR